MKAKKTYAVFGLGRYGTAVARELTENGMEVIAVDTEEKIVNDVAAYLPVCKCADVTDAEVISRLGRVKPDFCVLSGDDGLTLPLIAAGGDGVISVVSNLAPAIVTELCETCLKGDFEKAREIHYRLMPFFKAAFVDGNPTSIKYAMKVKGLPSGGMRLPLVEVNDKAKEIIKKALEECNL